MGGVLAQGVCTRPVTVGCCCSANPNINITFNNDPCKPWNMSISTDICCETTKKCQSFRVKIGTNKWLDIRPCETTTLCFTNYSTYLGGLDGKIQVEYKSFCHGSPVTSYTVTQPPFSGVFLGLDPTDPYNCTPANVNGVLNTSGTISANSGDPNSCGYFFSFLSDYSALPGAIFQGNTNLTRHVYVHPNSIIQVDGSYTFSNNVEIHMGGNSGWTVLSKPSSSITFELANNIRVTGACCLWRGIVVAGNGILRTQSSPPAKNTIEDAVFAVRPVSIEGLAPRLAMKDTRFLDNFISVLGNRGAFILTGSAVNPYFIRNEFSSTGLICMPDCFTNEIQEVLPTGVSYNNSISYAGFFIDGAPVLLQSGGVVMLGVNFIPTLYGDHNIFNRLAIGIECRNTSLIIPDVAQFRNIGINAYGPTTGIALQFNDRPGGNLFQQQGLVTNGTNQPDFNTFENCRIGINAISGTQGLPSILSIKDNRMVGMRAGITTNIAYGSNLPVLGDWTGSIVHNTISSLNQGIAVYDIAPTPSTLLIEDNTIDNIMFGGTGISIDGDNINGNLQADVFNNHINTAGGGVNVSLLNRGYIHENDVTSTSGTGYTIMNSRSEVECNTALGTSTVGMEISNTEILSDLSFNTFTNTGTGMQILGVSPAENLIQCNSFNANALGLRYDNATTGKQENTGNSWVGTGAEFVGPGSLNSIYTVPFGSSPNPVTPIMGWFIEDPLLIQPTCTKNCTLGMKPPKGGKLDEGIADGTINGASWYQWQLDQYLVRKLQENPTIATETPQLGSYLLGKTNSTVGRLMSARWQVLSLYEQNTTNAAILTNNATTLANKRAAALQIDLSLDDALSATQWDGFMAQRTVLANEVATLTAQNKSIMDQASTDRHTATTTLRNSISTIATTQVFEQNEKTVLDLLLQFAGNQQTPSTTQLATLKSIGEQCPKTGGSAVYWAAGIYKASTGEVLVQAPCAPGMGQGVTEERNAENAPTWNTVKVYPNPATSTFTVALPDGIANGRLTVTDIMGKTIYQTDLAQPVTLISSAAFAKGIYTLSVTVVDRKIQPVQLVIQH
jgi:hypothetical protein